MYVYTFSSHYTSAMAVASVSTDKHDITVQNGRVYMESCTKVEVHGVIHFQQPKVMNQ